MLGDTDNFSLGIAIKVDLMESTLHVVALKEFQKNQAKI